ncbi:hypothetical protein HpEKB20_07480 [Helicobacter pylori]|nr:hypothetical protein VN0211_02220 [Helicobacter pylori]GHQ20534.1 hypothetical protein VN1217_02130 [Helicobacter pylori]
MHFKSNIIPSNLQQKISLITAPKDILDKIKECVISFFFSFYSLIKFVKESSLNTQSLPLIWVKQ